MGCPGPGPPSRSHRGEPRARGQARAAERTGARLPTRRPAQQPAPPGAGQDVFTPFHVGPAGREPTAYGRLCAHTRTCSRVRMPPLYVRRGNGVPRAGGWGRPRRGSEGVRGPRSGDRSRTPRGRRPAGGPERVTRGPRGGSGCPPLQAPAHRPGFVLRFPHGRPARVWARPRAAALPTEELGAGPSAWSYF